MAVNQCLERLSGICLALPKSTREDSNGHATFRVAKKVFAYFLNNHQGDGIVAVTCKVLPGDNTALAAADPARFYLPAYIGSRGWVAMRLDLREVDGAEIDWEEVAEFVRHGYKLVTAPKPKKK